MTQQGLACSSMLCRCSAVCVCLGSVCTLGVTTALRICLQVLDSRTLSLVKDMNLSKYITSSDVSVAFCSPKQLMTLLLACEPPPLTLRAR